MRQIERRTFITHAAAPSLDDAIKGTVVRVPLFAGQPITDATALLDAIRSGQPGTRVSVTFIRSGTSHTVDITLGSAESLPMTAT